MKCSPQQRVYCAAYMTRMMLDRIEEQQEAIVRLENKVDRLAVADDGLFNPMDDEEEAVVEEQEEFETAQNDSGAENRLS